MAWCEQGLVIDDVLTLRLVELEVAYEVAKLWCPLVEGCIVEIVVVGGQFRIPHAHFVQASLVRVATQYEGLSAGGKFI